MLCQHSPGYGEGKMYHVGWGTLNDSLDNIDPYRNRVWHMCYHTAASSRLSNFVF